MAPMLLISSLFQQCRDRLEATRKAGAGPGQRMGADDQGDEEDEDDDIGDLQMRRLDNDDVPNLAFGVNETLDTAPSPKFDDAGAFWPSLGFLPDGAVLEQFGVVISGDWTYGLQPLLKLVSALGQFGQPAVSLAVFGTLNSPQVVPPWLRADVLRSFRSIVVDESLGAARWPLAAALGRPPPNGDRQALPSRDRVWIWRDADRGPSDIELIPWR